MEKLKSWFFNKVFRSKILHADARVFKIPQRTTILIWETKSQLLIALEAHQKYLGNALPETEIRTWQISPRNYYMAQKYVHWKILHTQDLINKPELQAQFDLLVEQWLAMENDKQLFFDMFGRNWFITNFSQFFRKHPNFMYSNFILTPDDEIKFIDVWHLPMRNPLVRCAKQISTYTTMRTKQYAALQFENNQV